MEDGNDNAAEKPPLKPFSKNATHAPARPPAAPVAPTAPTTADAPTRRPDPASRIADIPGVARHAERTRSGSTDSNQLVVGKDIRLKGEITACERLIVEGEVEVTLSDAEIIDVAPSGFFRGNASVVDADISGRFEGELTVHGKLTIRSTGRVNGSIRYGQIVIEPGGEITGDMRAIASDNGPVGN